MPRVPGTRGTRAGAGEEDVPPASVHSAPRSSGKRDFDIHVAMRRIEEAVRPYPGAALFELADRGYGSPFEQLVACILSIRTMDEVMLPTALALFERAATPAEMAALGAEEIDRIVRSCTFHEGKAKQIHEIARRVADEHGGELPCDEALILGFRGVGPKCTFSRSRDRFEYGNVLLTVAEPLMISRGTCPDPLMNRFE